MITFDTHTFIWWVSNPEKLSDKAIKTIDKELKREGEILVSSISVWEIYMLVKKGRLKLIMDVDVWLEKIEKLGPLQFVPVDNKIAAKSVMLPEPLHKDPADRIIIATSLIYGASLITSDKKILDYSHTKSIW